MALWLDIQTDDDGDFVFDGYLDDAAPVEGAAYQRQLIRHRAVTNKRGLAEDATYGVDAIRQLNDEATPTSLAALAENAGVEIEREDFVDAPVQVEISQPDPDGPVKMRIDANGLDTTVDI